MLRRWVRPLKPPLINVSTDRWCLSRYSISNPPLIPTTLLSSTHDTQVYFKNIEPYYSGVGKEQRGKGVNCSTDNIILYSLQLPLASPSPEPSLVSWQSPLRGDTVGSVADRAGSPLMWSPTHLTEVKPVTATGATNVRDSSKRTADSAGLNEGEEDVYRLKKARHTGQFASPSACRCIQ